MASVTFSFTSRAWITIVEIKLVEQQFVFTSISKVVSRRETSSYYGVTKQIRISALFLNDLISKFIHPPYLYDDIEEILDIQARFSFI